MKLPKFLKGKLKSKEVLKEQNKTSIDLRQKVYTKDKSRFFKSAWEEEKKQLYFK